MNARMSNQITWARFRLLSTSALLPLILGAILIVRQVEAGHTVFHSGAQDDKIPLYVYKDADFSGNQYKPTGYMGDCGDIQINEAFESNPHSGKTCIRVVYSAKGKGPNSCSYSPPCKWAGVYWQEPPNNWGTEEQMKGRGLDLSRYNRIAFWARADKKCTIEFKVGGISQRYGDSLVSPRGLTVNLTNNWQPFEIDLKGADLKHVIGGFCWAANWDNNPDGTVFYLDEIRFERRQ